MIKYGLLGIIFLFSLEAQTQVIDKIIVNVGSELILYSEWQEQLSYIKTKQAAALSKSDECSVLENMIVQKFLVNRAKIDSIEVKDEEVENQLNARIEQILAYFNNDYEKFREYYGQSVADTRERFRDDLKNQLLTERLQNKVIGDIRITPEETNAFFNAIPADSIPYFNAEVEISEIVYFPKLNEDQKASAKTRLENIGLRIKNGEDFSKLASLVSEDPGSARNGGSLGWTKRGSFVPEFEAVAFNLEKDSISGIVESEFGYHIIQLQERRGNSILCKHILIKPRFEEKDFEKAEAYLDSLRTKILEDSIAFEHAVRNYSDKKSESYNNGGLLINPNSGNANFETGELDPDVYFAIDQLKVGELSKVFSSSLADGTKVYKIVKLNSKIPPHKANLKDDYEKIQQVAKENKKNIKFQEWLAHRVPQAYIKIDKSIKMDCPGVGNWIPQEN